MATLHESVEMILDAIVDAVADAAETPGSGLTDVKTIVRGDRARPMPNLPAVWVVPQPAAVASQQVYGDEEAWEMPVSIAALVKGDDPAEAGKAAQRIAARAARYAKNVRAEVSGFIIDVRSQSFDATARTSEKNRTLFWCDATVRVTFVVDETTDAGPVSSRGEVVILDGGEE